MNIFPVVSNRLRLAAIALAFIYLAFILVPVEDHNLAAGVSQMLADVVTAPGPDPMPPAPIDPGDEERPDPSSPGLGI